MIPQITLVGAGPGDPDLLTVKGKKAIESANVILYDALVNTQLLDLAPAAKHIFVGKRKGIKAYEQEAINRLLVREAIVHGHAVRLKGGDSYVFGRGFEELEYARLCGIPVTVVPGISSSLAVPALAGISVTHRGSSNGFYVLTAVLADGSLNPEIEQAAHLQATVVVLMGLSQLEHIVTHFTRAGKSAVAAAVISNGSLPEQRQVVGQVATIAEKVRAENIQSPAVIVIGEVVEKAVSVYFEKQDLLIRNN